MRAAAASAQFNVYSVSGNLTIRHDIEMEGKLYIPPSLGNNVLVRNPSITNGTFAGNLLTAAYRG